MNQKNLSKLILRTVLLLSLIFCAAFLTVRAQTNTFTYQGRLTDQNNPAGNGTYQMQFALYDELTGGDVLGTVTINNVAVSNGVFTVRLDASAFAFAFDGAARYLEVRVFNLITSQYVTLTPRQQITSAPYAIRSLNAKNVEITGGNSVVDAINNVLTNATIDSRRLSPDVVRLKPETTQNAISTDASAALLDLSGTTVDSDNNVLDASRLLFNFDGSFGIFKNTTNPPTPLLKLNPYGGFVVGGTYESIFSLDRIPAEGAGTRMMWHPSKAAFRAGYVDGTQWNDANIGKFSTAMGESVRASGDNSTAFGLKAIASGSSSFAVGEGVVANSAASVALGYFAHTNARQGSFVFSDRSSVDVFRAEVNQTANWRVTSGFRIFTSPNLSTGVTIQSGTVQSNWGHTNAVISTSTGAYLSTSGVWTNNSSVHLKTNFTAVNSRDVLRKVLGLNIQTWNYKVDAPGIRHIGVTAQDFYQAFNVGAGDEHITPVDTAGVTMAAIQGLSEELDERAAKLQTENDRLKQKVEKQQKQIDALVETVCKTNQTADICRP